MNAPERYRESGFETMGLLLAVWICTLPFFGLLIAPLFGAQVALATAVGMLVLMLIFCWGRCIPQAIQHYRALRKRQPDLNGNFLREN